ncbi:siderophore-interacting protein [Rhodococcus chondri]|uniref:Siderophore-interacting protein n=1 Tax=Rhodococcus chondri TaxID=3065941 RepID=A0ABU7JY83_9NOCA|nr:siderophore-interacting protein [Rhodococcus sp. CC-R104]MEE2034499.1 siderophore-interacting protein [Rhodococcus sp. CC-R104]
MAERAGTARRTSKFLEPESRVVVRSRVLGAEQISPNFVRVTVGGSQVSALAPVGFDQWFRMFFVEKGSGTGSEALHLPVASDDRWWPEYRDMPDDLRPILRNYTIRRYRVAGSGRFGDTAEIEIDFASHGDLGPASTWANAVSAGEELGLLDEGIRYHPSDGAQWQLLVADESALPAVAAILDTLAETDPRAAVEVFAEVPHPGDLTAQQLWVGENVRVHPVIRTDPDVRPGVLATEAVRAAELPDAPAYAFVAGESDLATGVRRHLVRERGRPKSSVKFTGYWKYGEPVY